MGTGQACSTAEGEVTHRQEGSKAEARPRSAQALANSPVVLEELREAPRERRSRDFRIGQRASSTSPTRRTRKRRKSTTAPRSGSRGSSRVLQEDRRAGRGHPADEVRSPARIKRGTKGLDPHRGVDRQEDRRDGRAGSARRTFTPGVLNRAIGILKRPRPADVGPGSPRSARTRALPEEREEPEPDRLLQAPDRRCRRQDVRRSSRRCRRLARRIVKRAAPGWCRRGEEEADRAEHELIVANLRLCRLHRPKKYTNRGLRFLRSRPGVQHRPDEGGRRSSSTLLVLQDSSTYATWWIRQSESPPRSWFAICIGPHGGTVQAATH